MHRPFKGLLLVQYGIQTAQADHVRSDLADLTSRIQTAGTELPSREQAQQYELAPRKCLSHHVEHCIAEPNARCWAIVVHT